ncbi:hypothetical protein HYH02_005030 [Chlamydomonas schloesseri]|uniref:EGF-like domain-containing protein n=1 Tax=Chlamydomonas schloesseri TaxID=2026947 RepID=A0A835WNK2_9CHLO|nr:hypothetical protein HYH02_005030 [Chlamydomonas schloesseri]|eukprot:KAG2450529.1 hypothetical protein HYH02_005030 [Chlamydomonas schloesseri]
MQTAQPSTEPSTQNDSSPKQLTFQPLSEDSAVETRCARTVGAWCVKFHAQTPVPWRPAPRGAVECPDNCNGVGVCNHDTGYCSCRAGWIGEGCKARRTRPCTNHIRTPESESAEPLSHIGPDKRDLNWTELGFRASRCFGVCDDDLGACYCDGPMGRVPAPADAPPGTPPIRRGRPLTHAHDQPKATWDGKPTIGTTDYDKIYGPKGYCNVSEPDWAPSMCSPDDLGGKFCDEPVEAFCPGACSGHGFCDLGFCRCYEGYYGHDCARRKAGLPLQPSDIGQRPWLSSHVREPPAALEPPPQPTRKRPLIYVYDLDPLYNARLLQYRIVQTWCTHRHYHIGNTSTWSATFYGLEAALHEYLLISEHRTFDPEEADYFYVPFYGACMIYPVAGWADYPWFWTPGGPRVMQRRGGRDHIWLFTHDEGACWAPSVIKDSVWLTHWGRLDHDHVSNTAFVGDNYTHDMVNWRQPEGYIKHIKGHPCYDPQKDLVVPNFKSPPHYLRSPLQSTPSKPRDIFFFFKGDVGKHRLPHYSRGIRQKIYKMAMEQDWANTQKSLIGDGSNVHGDYSELLSRSLFCLVAPGDGWSPRLEDAVLHGCIPVIIADRVHAVFDSVLDVNAFSVRVPEADVHRVMEILRGISDIKIRLKQSRLGQVWHRYRYGALPGLRSDLLRNMKLNAHEPLLAEAANNTPRWRVSPPRPFKGDPAVDDAFGTIIQWLHSRIDYTRRPSG